MALTQWNPIQPELEDYIILTAQNLVHFNLPRAGKTAYSLGMGVFFAYAPGPDPPARRWAGLASTAPVVKICLRNNKAIK